MLPTNASVRMYIKPIMHGGFIFNEVTGLIMTFSGQRLILIIIVVW